MKNKFLAIVVVLVSLVGITANAQMKIGGSLAYATDFNGMGIAVNGVYKFTDNIEAAPNFTYYFEKDFVSMWSLDLNGHYIFSSNDQFDFYGIGGLEFRGMKVDLSDFGVGSASTTDFGLNVGAGARMNFNDKICGFGEFKFVLIEGSYAAFNFGVLYSL